MSEVTVIGLGSMGAALVRALLAAGHATTVWNRSPGRMQPLLAAGARGAASLAEAVAASATVISCVDAHATTRALLGASDVSAQLPGRTVVELSTGLPAEARESKAFFESRGAVYLDGKMLAGPHNIGQPAGLLVYAGPADEYRRLEPMLQALGGRTQHAGEVIGAAAALDLAWLSGTIGLFLGVAHGARICAAEGVPGELLPSVFPNLPSGQWLAGHIARREYENPGATLDVWRAALALIERQAKASGLAGELPGLASAILDRAIAAGHGKHHIAAIVEVMGMREHPAAR